MLGGADLGNLQTDIEGHSHSGIATLLSELNDVSVSSVAQGNILYRGATYWNNLAAGTLGNTLKCGGTGANPSWAALNLAGGAGYITGTLPTANGGTGATANANAASGVVVLNASSQLPAVSGALLTNLPSQKPTQVNDVETTGVTYGAETTILSVAKTITSGNTVLLIANGYCTYATVAGVTTIKLKQGSTVIQTIVSSNQSADNSNFPWSVCGIVTGLSGEITFLVTAANTGSTYTGYGNLVVLEF